MFLRLIIYLLTVTSLVTISNTAFGQWDFSGAVSTELRIFLNDPIYPEQDTSPISPSIAYEPEFVYDWNNSKDRMTLTPFVRWDSNDNNRTHADLREASWLHIEENWDLVFGVSKVFWGVTESRHLVDIINQTDAVEDIDGEDKLGQPMINLNLFRAWGTLNIFVLPVFRERTFPANDARLRGPLPIITDNATFDPDIGDHHIDTALRWTHSIEQWDIGLAYFDGISREPRFIPAVLNNQDVLIPHYDLINQFSLDLQLTTDTTLWKLEAFTRSGQGDRFLAAVGGLEYTITGMYETQMDIGIIVEYLYDERDNTTAPPTAADDDIFLASRLTFNDSQNTAFLAGITIDRNTKATYINLEAERRLGESWKLEIIGRFFNNIPYDSPFYGFSEDDFITLRLNYFY